MSAPAQQPIYVKPHPRGSSVTFIEPYLSSGILLPYFYQGIPAGFPSPAADHAQKPLDLFEHLVKHPAATFFARAEGDSMRELIYDGDLLVVDKAEPPQHESIVVASLDGEYLLKRLFKKRDELKLTSENKSYPPIIITEGMEFSIWGVVISNIRQLKQCSR